MPRPRHSGRSRSRSRTAPPRRSERDGALDRIQKARTAIAGKSLWLKRGSVGAVTLAVGIGVFQGWPALRWGAIPLALVFWWLDGTLNRADGRLQGLYDSVFEGRAPPPLMGDETAAADRLPEPPQARRRALVSGPGAGLHLMMAGVAVLFNILV